MEGILAELVAIPSVSGDREACRRIIDCVQGMLPAGIHAERVTAADGTLSLVASTRAERRADLVLNAHLDVVPARVEQFAARFGEGRACGRGVYDMKGAAAVYVQVLRDLAAERSPEAWPSLQVQFVTDEEIGGHGGARVLLEQGFTGGFFVAGEPTDLRICHRAKGVLWLSVHAAGRPGHAAMPWQADNPLVGIAAGLARVLEHFPPPQGEVWRTTATPTALVSGAAHNRVPAEALLKLDVRWIPEDDPQAIERFVQESFPGARVEVVQLGAVLDTPPDHPRVAALARLQEQVTGVAPRFYSEHYGSDARYYSAAGVAAICWGPCGGGMHADDEWLDMESLGVYYGLVRRLVG